MLLRLSNSFRYISVHSHYRLSYGGSYQVFGNNFWSKPFLKLSDNIEYICVHSHYRLSYGGIYSKTPVWVYALCRHLPIFPGRHQPSIFGTTELNFCVRYGNRWTLSVINTNYSFVFKSISAFSPFGDSCGNRTRVAGVRGRSLNRLTNEPCLSSQRLMVFALISPCNFSWCTIRGSNPGHPD